MRTFIIVLLLTTCTLANASNLTPDPNWASFIYNSATVNAKRDVDTIRVSLRLIDGLDPSKVDVSPHPQYTTYSSETSERDVNAITIIKKVSTEAALQLIIDLRKVTRPGNYDLIISLTRTDTKSVLALPFTITRPAAKLGIPPNVKIVLESWACEDITAFTLTETANSSNVRGLTLGQPVISDTNAKNLITFKENYYNIQAGTTAQPIIEINKDAWCKLSIGTHTAQLAVSADEITVPVTVNFEIIRKRSKWLIPILILLGSLTGLMFRNLLVPNTELLTRKIEGRKMLDEVNPEISTIKDSDFITTVKPWITRLESLINNNHRITTAPATALSELNSTITNTKKAYDEAKADLAIRLNDNIKNLNQFDRLLKTPAFVEPLASMAADAVANYTAAKGHVNNKDAKSATACINVIKSTLEEAIEVLSKYAIPFAVMYQSTPEAAIPVLAGSKIVSEAKTGATEIKTDLDKITLIESLPEKANTINNILKSGQELVAFILQKSDENFNHVYRDDGTEIMKQFQEKYHAWHTNTEKVFLSVKDGRLKFNLTQSKDALDQVWNNVPAAFRSQITLSSPQTDTQQGFSLSGDLSTLAPAGKHQAPEVATLTESNTVNSLNRQLFHVNLLRTGIVLILTGFAGYIYYEKAYLGTVPELISMFILAFGMDITVENVAKMIERTPLKP